MAEGQEYDPKQLPVFIGPSVGEVQNMLEEALADVLWADGLEHLASIKEDLHNIAGSLDQIASTLRRSVRR